MIDLKLLEKIIEELLTPEEYKEYLDNLEKIAPMELDGYYARFI